MIKALAKSGDRTIVILGLTNENVARLYANEPVLVRASAPPPAGLGLGGAPDIVIIAGRDEDSIISDMRRGGLVPDDPADIYRSAEGDT
jgi:hypothetical protein